MDIAKRLDSHLLIPIAEVRALADQAFSRIAGAPLVPGNHVRLLVDARENYPAWLKAINEAQKYILFENYLIQEDAVGRKFADALITKAQDGVHVRLVYDWLGCLGTTSRKFWNRLRMNGVDVRCYNPPRLDSPLGWVSRDHRKLLSVDGQVGFVSGLCVARRWEGIPERRIEPWRDTGIEVRGPLVTDIERAFAQIWALTGDPLPAAEISDQNELMPVGQTAMRIVANLPASTGTFRLDQLVAALARKRLWLTDAYYVGTTGYVQTLRAAAQDGVDVRLLVPNGTNIPLLKPLSRAGYRTLLEAGVRIFEWNGTMIHAKTAVADGLWARIGSTNLNITSWLGNCELDAVVEDEAFAKEMEDMYLHDLTNATEIVLDQRFRVRAPGQPVSLHPIIASGGGKTGRAGTGAVRITHTVGAAFSNRRELHPFEARSMTAAGVGFLMLSILTALFPRVISYPIIAALLWFGSTLLYRSYKMHRIRRTQNKQEGKTPAHQ